MSATATSHAHPAHIPALDALRGIAACVVVASHVLATLRVPGSWPAAFEHWLLRSPLAPLVAGHEAVILFFLISGAVLSLPAVTGTPRPPRVFLIRRVCRLYPAYLAALTLAVLCAWGWPATDDARFSAWFNAVGRPGVDAAVIAQHVLLIGLFANTALIPVLWSLVHEMRLSLVFPWLSPIAMRQSSARLITTGLTLAVTGALLERVAAKYWPHIDLGTTLIAASAMVAGALFARHRTAVAAWYRRTSPSTRVAMWLAGWLLYGLGSQLPGPAYFFRDIPIAIGSWLLVSCAASSVRIGEHLRGGVWQWIGARAYSLYLLHTIVLITVLRAGVGRAPMGVLVVSAVAVTIVMADAAYRWIERPGIALGRRLTSTGASEQ